MKGLGKTVGNRLQRFQDLVEEENVHDVFIWRVNAFSARRKRPTPGAEKKKQGNLVSHAALENPEHQSSILVSTVNQT